MGAMPQEPASLGSTLDLQKFPYTPLWYLYSSYTLVCQQDFMHITVKYINDCFVSKEIRVASEFAI